MATKPTKNLVLTHSSRQTYEQCPYKYFLTYGGETNYKPIWYSDALVTGSLVHDLLEVYNNQGYSEALTWLSQNTANKPLTVLKAKATLIKYHAQYGGKIKGEAEGDFKIWIDSIEGEKYLYNIYIAGKRDLKDNEKGILYEYKTTALDIKAGGNFWRDAEVSLQHVGYYMADLMLGNKVEIVKYIAMSRELIKLKKNETPDEYVDRYVEKMTIKERDFIVTDEDIARFKTRVKGFAQELINHYESGVWDCHYSLCNNNYGLCPFYDHCKKGVDIDNEELYIKKDRQHEELNIENDEKNDF